MNMGKNLGERARVEVDRGRRCRAGHAVEHGDRADNEGNVHHLPAVGRQGREVIGAHGNVA